MRGTKHDPRFTIGMVEDWHGQHYELINIVPHQRKGGRDTLILIWRSTCLDCGEMFETKAPRRKFRAPARRCKSCVQCRKKLRHSGDLYGAHTEQYTCAIT